MAFWGGVWMSIFLIGVVAFGSLLSPNAAERRSVSAIALGSDSGVATQPLENRGKVPLWMFGAIAITCTAGSILVSRQLQPDAASPKDATPKRVRQTRQTVPPRQRNHPARNFGGSSQRPKRLKPYSPTASLPHQRVSSLEPVAMSPAIAAPRVPAMATAASPLSFVVARPTSSGAKQAVRPAMSAPLQPPPASSGSLHPSSPSASGSSKVTEVPVTVVPADQVHPLDWPQPRLADAMDLRKRQSIQSLL